MNIVQSSSVLVAKTRTGNDKFWQAHVATDGTGWFIQSSHWQVNKKGLKSVVQFSTPYECVPKNVGKTNETTAKEQAYSEFDSMVTKQIDKGYAKPGTVSTVRPLPMLAHKFKERGKKLAWPVHVQPKYNGMRMLYKDGEGWSRGGKDIIPECIAHIQCDTDGVILDGELILPGNVLLQETMKATKKFRPGLSDTLQYIVYDIVDPTLTFSERSAKLKQIVRKSDGIVLAPTHHAEDVGEVMSHHKQFTRDGYEGTIIRDDSGGYEIGQRSNQLQKFKDFVDDEFTIVAVKQGDGLFKGAAIFTCETRDGTDTFDCTPEGSLDHKRALYNLRKELIGQWLTVRYQELSADKKPLFPVGVALRQPEEF